jgi:hypothetical protein
MAKKLTKELSLAERFMLATLLPDEGKFETLRLVRELRNELSPTEEEHGLANFRTVFECPKCKATTVDNKVPMCPDCGTEMRATQATVWDDKVPVREFEISRTLGENIKDALKKMDEEEKLPSRFYSLYEKFIEVK